MSGVTFYYDKVRNKCCYCGKTYRERSLRLVKSEGHGPHGPHERIYDDRKRREVGSCPDRPPPVCSAVEQWEDE